MTLLRVLLLIGSGEVCHLGIKITSPQVAGRFLVSGLVSKWLGMSAVVGLDVGWAIPSESVGFYV